MAHIDLTEGAAVFLANYDASQPLQPLVMQVCDLRPVTSTQQNKELRYRMILSDGCYSQQGMLATQHNGLVRSELLLKGSIVKLMQYVCNYIQGRMIVIVVDLEVIVKDCDIIGVPRSIVSRTDGNVSSNQRSPPSGLPIDQPTHLSGNPPSYGGSSSVGVNPPSYGVSAVGGGNPPSYGGSAAGGGNPPSYGGSAAGGGHPSSYGGSAAGGGPPPFYGGSASRPNVVANSFNGKMDSGRYNPPNVAKTDYSAAVSRSSVNNHVGSPQSSFPRPPPMYGNRGPVGKNEAAQRTIPIAALNPYQGRWTIMARVTSKTEMRHYSNNKGPGKVFSFDLIDSADGEIRVTCFNDVAGQFYDQIKFGNVYMITKGTLKPARKDFNNLGHEYEITLDSTSTVQPCPGEKSIPELQFRFRPISEIEILGNNTVVDVIGIVSSIVPSVTIQKKDGTQTQKRTLNLKDMSGKSVELTMWGNYCNNEGSEIQTLCDSGEFPILAVKSAKVSDFNGRSMGTISGSQLLINHECLESKKLREWFDSVGKTIPAVHITKESRPELRKTLSEIKEENLGTFNKPDWVTVPATLIFIKLDNFCYTACPLTRGERQCSKKLTDTADGRWQCSACGKVVVDCDYRYILQIQIQDHTGSSYVTAFQEGGQEIMGVSAKDMYAMKCEDEEKFAELIKSVLFTKFMFKLKVKEETHNDESRVKSSVVKAEKISFETEIKNVFELIENPNKMDSARTENVISTPGLSASGYVRGSQAPYNGSMARETAIHASQIGGDAYGNQYTSGGSRPLYMSCNSCGSVGHTEANCPSLMSGPAQSYEASQSTRDIPATGNAYGSNTGGGECYRCHQPGHFANNCPSRDGGGGGGGGSNECYKCHQPGHFASNCPSSRDARPAYGGGGVSDECYKCHQPGHFASNCPNLGGNPGGYGRAPNQRVGGY